MEAVGLICLPATYMRLAHPLPVVDDMTGVPPPPHIAHCLHTASPVS